MAFIGLGGLFGFFVCLVLLIVAIFRKTPKWKILIGMAVCFVLFVVAVSSSDSKENKTAEETGKSDRSTQSAEPTDNKSQPSIVISAPDKNFDTSDYLKFDSEVLFEYGNYFSGEKVITVVTAYQPGTNIKAQTENNDGFFYSLIFEFEDEEAPKQVKEGDVLTIAGTIKEKPEVVDMLEFLETPTVTLENCSIIGHGEIAQELKAGAAELQSIGEQRKAEIEAQIAGAKKAERDNYIAECTTINYNDVARNPDNYKGVKIKISGEVIQVAEGWFNGVTLRVDCGGDIWYVTYSREEGESRILEGDQITGYGECDGVTSYTNVLGSQVTIPSMRMEYYD